jgi:hypothetical protein
MPDTAHGFFVFTREISDRYIRSVDIPQIAETMGAPEWILPSPPDARTAISRVLRTFGQSLRSKKMDMRKVKAGTYAVEYALLGPDQPVDGVPKPHGLVERGRIKWTAEAGLEFAGLIDAAIKQELQDNYKVACTLLGKDDWHQKLRQLYTGRWCGWSARQGGVVYWIAPGELPEVAMMRTLMLATSGVDMLSGPCLSAEIAQSIVELGLQTELASMTRRNLSAPNRIEALTALKQKVTDGCARAALTLTDQLGAMFAVIDEDIGKLELEPEKPKRGGGAIKRKPIKPVAEAAPEPKERKVRREIVIGAQETPPAPPPPPKPEDIKWAPGGHYFDGIVEGQSGPLETYRPNKGDAPPADHDWKEAPEELGTYYCTFSGVVYVARISQ